MQTSDGIGYLLRDLRQRQGLSRKLVAERAQVGARTLEYWEAGTRSPRMPELEAVLKALGASAEERMRILAHLTTPRGMRLKEQDVQSKPQELRDPIPNLGELLRMMRLRHGLTQQGLAVALGVRRLTVQRWELNEHFPEEESLDRVCRLLCAHPEEHTALLARRLISPQTIFRGISNEISKEIPLEECEEQFSVLTEALLSGWSPLIDLSMLAFERQLRLLAPDTPHALSLLVKLNYYYSRWLLYQGRVLEAQVALQRAHNAATVSPVPEQLLAGRLNLEVALIWSRSHDRQKMLDFLLRSVQGRQSCLSRSTDGFIAYCDLAFLYANMGQADGMQHWLSVAHQTLQSTHTERPEENRYYRTSSGRSLTMLGKPIEAMEWLPPLPSDTSTFPALMPLLLWAETLIVAGDKQTAEPLMLRIESLIARHRITMSLRTWQTLARRL